MARRSPGNARVDDRWHNNDGAQSSRHGTGKRWTVRWVDLSGKEKEKSFRKKSEATRFADHVTADITRGEYVDHNHQRTTIEHAWEEWFPAQSHWKPATRRARKSTWGNHVAPVWEKREIGSIRKPEIQRWIADMSSNGAGASTIYQAVTLFRQVLEHAVDSGYIASNPCLKVKTPRSTSSPRPYLTVEQVHTLANALTEHKTFIYLLAFTGVRWGEGTALRVDAVDFAARRLSIHRADGTDEDGKLIEGTPKNHEIRSVPFPVSLSAPLRSLTVGKGGDGRIFTTPSGSPLLNGNFRKRKFDPIVEQLHKEDAGFPDITIHDLRHTAASIAISAGANVKAVQRMLGHASAAITLDTYSDLFDEDLDKVAEKIDSLVSCGMGAGYSSKATF